MEILNFIEPTIDNPTFREKVISNVRKITKDTIYYNPFIIQNPVTDFVFPDYDEVYYESLLAQLIHELYKFKEGWTSSERQVMVFGNECISTVHFLFDLSGNVTNINVFQRSSNLEIFDKDCQFFNYFIVKELMTENSGIEINLTIFNSSPHRFLSKKHKID